ncbi:MAG: hypothetical protein RL329_971 [Bacteroidota bacterium]|jgi:hypothetical protein
MNLRGFCAADFGAGSPTQTCTATWAISTVADVRSLNFQLHGDACASAWELAKSKIIKAQKTKAQTYQDVGNRIPASQKGLNKQQGIKDNVNTSGKDIVGICQLPLDSAREAVGWAKAKNVGAAFMAERGILPNALFLTPAYLGRILEILDNGNTIPPNTACLDKKRLVFASYNAGPATLKLAITACLKVKKEIQWSDAAFQNCLASVLVNLAANVGWNPAKKLIEVNNYIKFIEKRLQ